MMIYLLLAIIIDLIIGDPRSIPHPVVIIGKFISKLEAVFFSFVNNDGAKKIAGIVLVLIVVFTTYFISSQLINLGFIINFYLGIVINIWLLSTTIAIKGLRKAGLKIYYYLKDDNINQARTAVAEIVGRDTDKMKGNDIVRAAVETIAENTSDGIIAPIFFYLIGGTPLALAYKAVNTLDSMLGYKNEKYRHFGWSAARFDDLVNFLPARLTGIGFCIAALVTRGDWKKGWQIMIRDAGKHPSWNAGYPEAAVAGSMGVSLGGLNYYHGKPAFRAYLGDKNRELLVKDIKLVIRLMSWNVFLIISLLIMFGLGR